MRPDAKFDLAGLDPDSTAGAPGGKDETRAAIAERTAETEELQEQLWACKEHAVLLVLQAMDAGGKDGAIKALVSAMNPQGLRITNFKAPTEEERSRDFLWRIHNAVPGLGEVGIFNRSHYEEVLVVRVHSLVPEKVWRPRYDRINAFEALLTAGGTKVVKIFLHISAEEQTERLRARLEDPTKRWKFRLGDLDDRDRWDEFMAAYEEAIGRTSSSDCPWYAVPADHKWYRDWAVTNILRDTLADLDPRYPMPPDDEVADGLRRLGG